MARIQTPTLSLLGVTMHDCVHLILSAVFLRLTLNTKGTNACTDTVVCSNGLINMNPLHCYRIDMQRKCCKSCKNAYTGIAGCEYGDKVPDCIKLYCDIYFLKKTDCCSTCSSNDAEHSVTTTEVNAVHWNSRTSTQTPPHTVDKTFIIGVIVGVIVFLMMVIPAGFVVWKKVSRRQNEASHPTDFRNRPFPLPRGTSSKEKEKTRNQSSVHIYDIPDNGYIDTSRVYQVSRNLTYTELGGCVNMATTGSTTAGSSMYTGFSTGHGASAEALTPPLTTNWLERTDGYLTVVK